MSDSTTNPPVKRCKKCSEEFPVTSEFWHKNPKTIDALSIYCKPCAIKRSKDRYHQKRDEIRAKSKSRYNQKRDEINAKKREAYRKDPSKRLEENKKYRRANPEKIASSKRNYNQRNSETIKAKRKQSYAKNRTEAIAASRAYYRANKSAISHRRRAYNRQYNMTHQEEKRLWALEHYRRNHDKAKAAIHRRLARKRSLPSTLTGKQWETCLEYFNHRCAVCERPVGFWHTLAPDHWIPLSSPDCPGTIVDNIIPLCHGDNGCNNSKGAKPANAWLIARFGKRKAQQILDQINAYFEWVKQQN